MFCSQYVFLNCESISILFFKSTVLCDLEGVTNFPLSLALLVSFGMDIFCGSVDIWNDDTVDLWDKCVACDDWDALDWVWDDEEVWDDSAFEVEGAFDILCDE